MCVCVSVLYLPSCSILVLSYTHMVLYILFICIFSIHYNYFIDLFNFCVTDKDCVENYDLFFLLLIYFCSDFFMMRNKDVGNISN